MKSLVRTTEKRSLATAITLVAFCSIMSPAGTAKDMPLAPALESAGVMPKGYKINASTSESEALIQTHLPEASADSDKDCKIDAVLLAKIVLNKRPQIAKVKVRFFNTNNTHYRQIVVTAGDVAAYGGGSISVEKLLKSLEIAEGGSGGGAETEASANNFLPVDVDGVHLRYPPSWQFARQNSDGYIADFTIPSKSWAKVLVRKQNTGSPQQQSGYDENYLKSIGHRVIRQGPTTVGNGQIPGYELLTLQNTKSSAVRYEEHVYFGPAGYVYSLNLSCDANESNMMSPEFLAVLRTVSLR
jgi:hypothetical protein